MSLGVFLPIAFDSPKALAQEEATEPPPDPLRLNMGPQLFFDADSTAFTRDGQKQVFKGNVVAVGGGILITADNISLDRTKETLEADGHVIILTENQVFLGDKLVYQSKTSDFLIINAVMTTNDARESTRISNAVLGFSPAELSFEEMRDKRLQSIAERKDKLRDQYRKEVEPGQQPPTPLIDQYSLLLEQEDLTKGQENPYLGRMNEERRNRFKARREHWQRGLEQAKKLGRTQASTSFFQIRGKKLVRVNGNDYFAEDSFWTPCKCDEGELPAWGFYASEMEAQMEGYLDFYHPVLQIKGLPILYLPYLKVPIKQKRQSGFLPPTYANLKRAGNIFSQPIFFDINDSMDTTVTPELYENRGTKVGVEMRYQQKQYSGVELKVEGIRDQLWMEDRKLRESAREYWLDEEHLENECRQDDPNLKADCIRKAKNRLALPKNSWRGSQSWKALSILAPRLSFASTGTLYSDHRYVEELTLYEDFRSALDASTRATYFTTAKYRLHLDAKNFYAGVGGAYGDSVLTNERFQGQQMPAYAVLQSRFYELDRQYLPIPVYGQVSGEHKLIRDWQGETEGIPQLEGENRTLGSGVWQRLKISQVSPLLEKSIFQLSQFSDWEARGIQHSGLAEQRSSIQSWRVGLTLKLPIDGEAALPGAFQDTDSNGNLTKHIRHYMDWALTFSVRPSVTRNGPYGKFANQYFDENNTKQYVDGGELVYFASDRSDDSKIDEDLGEDQTMIKHRRVTFSTAHTWDVFDRGWDRLPGKEPEADKKAGKETYTERAKRELIYSFDRPVTGVEDMFGDDGWFINRYQLTEKNKKRIIEADGNISYDFEKVEKRRERRAARAAGEEEDKGQMDLPQPWSEPVGRLRVNLFDTSLSNETRYNIYYRIVVHQGFKLILPEVLKTVFTLGYNIGNRAVLGESNTLLFQRITEQTLDINSTIVPHYVLTTNLGRRTSVDPTNVIRDPKPEYFTKYGVLYISPSECWKLGLMREVKYGADNRNAEYLLQLTVLFLGTERPVGDNLEAGLVRELPNHD